jgi:hypothetical protein
MNKKFFFLLLALIVPVLVFTFLKFFGKNEFTVVPLYQTTESKLPPDCPEVNVPYFISDSVYSLLKQGHEGDSLLILLYESRSKDLKASEAQLIRVQESFQLGSGLGLNRISVDDKSLSCSLLLQSSLDLVLVDAKKRIRGQYNSNDRDEVDRLMTELDIILKRY